MRIVIVTVEEKCPAWYALKIEHYDPEIVLIENEFTYGETLHRCWERREAFLNIEHDMAPWQGAVEKLRNCTHDLCLFGYPRAEQGSLGMVRFSANLIEKFPQANFGWDRTAWHMLEGSVYAALRNVEKHQHYPGIAHLSGWYR